MSKFSNAQLYSCFPEGTEPDWADYDALELHGGALIDYGDGTFGVETGVDNDEVEAYSIQAHYREGGGTDDITDVRDYAEAIEILSVLAGKSGLRTNVYVDAPKASSNLDDDASYPAARFMRTTLVMGRMQPGYAPAAAADPLEAYAAFLHLDQASAHQELNDDIQARIDDADPDDDEEIEDVEDALADDGIEACLVHEDGTITGNFGTITREEIFTAYGVDDVVEPGFQP